METDTIAAIATTVGEASIAVIRVSGPESIVMVDRLYQGKHSLQEVETHTVRYGHIIDPLSNHSIDEVLVTVMRAPRTFTREDVVEISCHGGMIPVQKVLEALLAEGMRLAEPGEFTKRAFMNGRIDLSQAEGVMDLIRSKTDRAAQVASQQADGRLSRLIQRLRQDILESLAHLAVNVDYPEYDAEQLTAERMLAKSREVEQAIQELLTTARQGKILREGIATVIIGRPNVGKSSLLNALAHENRAIVTDIPGTTRDVIEEFVNVRGIPLRLVDTAGIRETEDIVEKMGVERSHQALAKADLVLLLLNHSEELEEEDRKLIELARQHATIVVVNKTDLPPRLDMKKVRSFIDDLPLITTSVTEEQGLSELEQAIADRFLGGAIQSVDATYVTNTRHIHQLKEAQHHVRDAIEGIEQEMPLDMIEIDLKNAWVALGEIIGDAVAEDLIDQIFSQFCLGK
ncbi:tRNA uridine-5-carboxymethylaminomethyl(34) synthesis GTPase MnmE [Marininema halotolerans]|uniref:tRNA modification GTPase MnmE n=1 Tax=Marininema halotolerans TaxID=1155944 RepID=A0A1I6PB86_9BACL|nr:tRNA uridine-5-carboxymethylaminomethyl(34) synthesis GTPase MnmE [Marininema halotolerans]SFS37358.1 tRNA modification GTPase [Marininema halotolerans]